MKTRIVIGLLILAGCDSDAMNACKRLCWPYRVETFERSEANGTKCVCSKTEKIE
jgi:hypothetical protein